MASDSFSERVDLIVVVSDDVTGTTMPSFGSDASASVVTSAPGRTRNPVGTVTPGPIAWQMRIGNGSPSVGPETPNLGGYVYATSNSAPIVANAGTPVTVQLSESLTIP